MKQKPDISLGRAVSVRDHGAVGDGSQDDAAAIQRALDAGGHIVYIPTGRYRIGATLRIGSGMTLVADEGAELRLADGVGKDRHVFLLTNRHHDSGDSDIRIVGGVWDGNAGHNPRGRDGDENAYTGVAINFVHVERLAIQGLTVRNPESFFIRLGEVRDFLVEDRPLRPFG